MDTQETKIFIAISIAAILLAIVLLFFIITLVKHQRKNAALYKQKIIAEITTLEKERKRIASDLHDDLGPILSTVKLQINSLNISDIEDRDTIARTSKYIDNMLEKVRETSNNLMPNVLIRKGLLVAIEEFAENINKTNALKITTDLRSHDVKFTEDQEIHIFRMVQETVNNTLRHSNASDCYIQLLVKDNLIQLLIKDNGKGFDSKGISTKTLGFGLKNILSRVEILKGDMYLDTKPGSGVIYTIDIPLQAISHAS